MRAWLASLPHPDAAKRRTMQRRTPDGLRSFVRVPIYRVEVIETLKTIRLARVRYRVGSFDVDTWAPFDRLGSDRARFRQRLEQLATLFPEPAAAPSGASSLCQ